MKNYVNSLAKIEVIMVHWGKKFNLHSENARKMTNNDKEMASN